MKDTYTKSSGKIHLGKNVARIRDLKGIKQEVLATELGISQQAVSQMEQKGTMNKEKLEEVAKALGVKPEAIKEFTIETAITIINDNCFHDNSSNNRSVSGSNQPIFNPVEKEKELYKILLKREQEKNKLFSELHKIVFDLVEEVKKLEATIK